MLYRHSHIDQLYDRTFGLSDGHFQRWEMSHMTAPDAFSNDKNGMYSKHNIALSIQVFLSE